MKINFVLPPTARTGGPLAIMEYAAQFIKMGHTVSITTYPVSYWPSEWKTKNKPYPWYDFPGKIYYVDDTEDDKDLLDSQETILNVIGRRELKNNMGFPQFISDITIISKVIGYMPDCDINIATAWLTAYAVYFSQKGKPVYFMQHYEEVFERIDCNRVLKLLEIRGSYALPMYKIANSSWLKQIIYDKYGQDVPFSLNAMNVEEFYPRAKKSKEDGIIRILSYCDNREWKGFGDVAEVIMRLKEDYGSKVEWHTFGQEHNLIRSDNIYAPYTVHKNISFTELSKLYAECDIMLCGSWYESFPLPPLEAMASGTAVVTTWFGTEDYCEHMRNCLCVSARNTKEMYEAVKMLIEDENLRKRLEAEGVKTAQAFSWDSAAKIREKMLEDILEDKVEYNINLPIGNGIKDLSGAFFSEMPADLKKKYPDGKHIRQGERYFIIEKHCKRLICDPIYLSKLKTEEIEDINEIECMRIPMGFTIYKME